VGRTRVNSPREGMKPNATHKRSVKVMASDSLSYVKSFGGLLMAR
jgi:hypothetical protein